MPTDINALRDDERKDHAADTDDQASPLRNTFVTQVCQENTVMKYCWSGCN